MNIFLVGYMGSGKSTIGKQLSAILDFNFLDFDNLIEEKEDAIISTIFKNKGEVYFRKQEYKYLLELFKYDNHVVSLGGGTPCYGHNMEQIKAQDNVVTVYLKAKIPTLVDRLILEKEKRPLISHIDDRASLTEFVGKHLFERSKFYLKSDLVIDVDDLSPEKVVNQIVALLF
ncbi:shikimate kinase [Mangrovimonas spongiae]|uniref:Shikimate kinase n=1 Tax=Mangrovimonas spongiae TaxID=2494697 RepID=A0A428JYY2_9FLAO|nr:shikimate kinase [Mangrovimonas spongiae]RSK39362.1 shikimate kinase [Mangrovimonas spongiae]